MHRENRKSNRLMGEFFKMELLKSVSFCSLALTYLLTLSSNVGAESDFFTSIMEVPSSTQSTNTPVNSTQQTASATATKYYFEPLSNIMQFKSSSNTTFVPLVDNLAYLNWHSVGRRYQFNEGHVGDSLYLETRKPNGSLVSGEWLWDDTLKCWDENWLLGVDCWPPGSVVRYFTQSSQHGVWYWHEEINGIVQEAWQQTFRVVGLNLDVEGDSTFSGRGGSTIQTPLKAKLYGNDEPDGASGWNVRFTMPSSLAALGFGLIATPGDAPATSLTVDSGAGGIAQVYVVLGESEQSFTVSAAANVAPIDSRDPPLHLSNPSYSVSSWLPDPPDTQGEGLDEGKNFGKGHSMQGACNNLGNPVNVITGNKFQSESDVVGNSAATLSFTRYYNGKDTRSTSLGQRWRHTYDRTLIITKVGKGKNAVTYADIKRPDGREFTLTDHGGGFVGDPDIYFALVKSGGKWELHTDQDTVELYDGKGLLLSITDSKGNVQRLNYNNQKYLVEVVTNSNESLTFNYDDSTGLLSSINYLASNPATSILPRRWAFGYSNGMLASVTNPDGTQRQYHYENTRFPNALTGITDERGIRYATWDYDDYGYAINSFHANNAKRIDLTFDAAGARTATNSLGNITTYESIAQLGMGKITRTTGPTCSTGDNSAAQYNYDPANGNLLSKTIDGTTTQYGNYDTNGNPGFMIEAVGTPLERRTDYTYDLRFHSKVTRITEPSVYAGASKVTNVVYDEFGNMISRTINGFKPDGTAISRTTTYQYNGPYRQLSQIDGPRTDVSDITTFEYYPDNADLYQSQGMLQRVISPEGIMLRDNLQYNEFRQLVFETRPNGLSMTYSWEENTNRLSSMTESGGSVNRTTRWTYLPTGEIETVTFPDGTALTYAYDDARRLTRITDTSGNYIRYNLDTEGNLLNETVHDANDVLHKALVRSFDVYNRLDGIAQANEIMDYDFSADGTLAKAVNGNNVQTDYSYDDLKRLLTTDRDSTGADPGTANSLVSQGYDAQDNLIAATDPKSSQTSYSYDDLGNLVTLVSPDTGATAHTYDEAGNRTQTMDAKGQVFTLAYDALNRLITRDAPGASHDLQYVYDSCANGVGRLCSLSRDTTITQYAYNSFGEVVTKSETVQASAASVNSTLTISYDSAGRIQTISYPGNISATYSYDSLGNLNQLTLDRNGLMTDVISNTAYKPFGPIIAMTLGNGINRTLMYDDAYRLTALNDPVYDTALTYDANGNIIDQARTLGNLSASYDALDKLTDATGPLGAQAYQYDRNANRTLLTDNGTPTSYAYEPSSNRLSQIGSEAVTLDANGNTIFLRGMNLTYSPDNRLTAITGIVNYGYNGLGERVWKTASADETVYLYGAQGQLMAELSETGQIEKAYLWFNGEPVGMVDNLDTSSGVLYYSHNDHLGTPQALTDETGTVVWRATYKPFGLALVDDDPDTNGNAVTFNLRFPGQYFDEESGLRYNYYRYLDTEGNRYITADPIGILRDYSDPQLQLAIRAGIPLYPDPSSSDISNTLNHIYNYADQNPIGLTDPFGLAPGGKRPKLTKDQCHMDCQTLHQALIRACQATGYAFFACKAEIDQLVVDCIVRGGVELPECKEEEPCEDK